MVSVDEVRQWNSPVTMLARFDQYVWQNDQTFAAELQASNFGPQDLDSAFAKWALHRADGTSVADGKTDPINVLRGGLSSLGKISFDLGSIEEPTQLQLTVTMG